MKSYSSYFAVSVLIFLSVYMFSCQKEEDESHQEYEILIYGREVCSNCEKLMRKCDDNNVDYTFYDIDKDSEKRNEMQQKCWEAGFGNSGSVTLPIVDVILADTSYLYENPSFADISAVLPEK
ncbi:MAG: glutaredoxin [Bacteroidales bacterium]|nr:glutaredoxin [Bacteroidales bacterium]